MTLSGKKVMLVLFFDINGHIVQASVPRGQPVAGTFYAEYCESFINI